MEGSQNISNTKTIYCPSGHIPTFLGDFNTWFTDFFHIVFLLSLPSGSSTDNNNLFDHLIPLIVQLLISNASFSLHFSHAVTVDSGFIMALNGSTPKFQNSAIFSLLAQAGPSGPLLVSHSPCAVLCHSWCHSALSVSVPVSVSLLDYGLFEVGD